jgi:hypothetical protein
MADAQVGGHQSAGFRHRKRCHPQVTRAIAPSVAAEPAKSGSAGPRDYGGALSEVKMQIKSPGRLYFVAGAARELGPTRLTQATAY